VTLLVIKGAVLPLLGYFTGEVVLYRIDGQDLHIYKKYNVVQEKSFFAKVNNYIF
jgi:hypothetical protein